MQTIRENREGRKEKREQQMRERVRERKVVEE
jgi:hypothetical protein